MGDRVQIKMILKLLKENKIQLRNRIHICDYFYVYIGLKLSVLSNKYFAYGIYLCQDLTNWIWYFISQGERTK